MSTRDEAGIEAGVIPPAQRGALWQRRRTPTWVKNLRVLLSACLLGLVLGAASLVSPAVGLALALAFVAVYAAMQKPIVLGYLTILGIAFTSGMQRGALLPQVKPNEIILLAVAVLTLPFIILKRVPKVRFPRRLIAGQAILALGTALLPLVSYPLRGIALSFSEIFSLSAPLQYLLLFWVFSLLPANDREQRNLFALMIASSVAVALIGMLQAAQIGPVIRFLNTYYPSQHSEVAQKFGRITSVMGAWNGLGTYFVVTLLFLVSYQQPEASQRSRRWVLAAMVLCGLGLLASGSFAGVFGLVVGMLIISLITRRGFKNMALMFAVLLLAGILLSGYLGTRMKDQFGQGEIVPQTLAYRFYLWKTIFIPLAKQYWLWGYRASFTRLAWAWAESQYLFLLLRTGIWSLLAHFAWVGLTLSWLVRKLKTKDPLAQSLATGLFSILIVLSIMGFTNEVFTYSGVMDYVWIALGLLAGSSSHNTQEALTLQEKI